jgi:hypothetical protein
MWQGKSMTVTKVTVSLDPVVAERARRDVADGKAKSLIAWLSDAGRAPGRRRGPCRRAGRDFQRYGRTAD